MNADIRTVKLCRRSVGINESAGADRSDEKSDTSEDRFFATDYFDELITEKKSLKDSFSSMMGISDSKETCGNQIEGKEISVQSYTLFFSNEMQLEYEEKRKDMDKGRYASDPFDSAISKDKLPFLSIIQVHITPEVLRRMEYDAQKLWLKSNGMCMKIFMDDLYAIMDDFSESSSYSFICRIYQLFSAGDFAVVIRSDKAETSYAISACIRRRVMGRMDGTSKKYVIYKTYTLLTMNNYRLGYEEENKQSAGTQGRFVVRCCFSNQYWSNENFVRDELNKKGITPADVMFGLNGRYDFSVQLEISEFHSLFPYIIKFKHGISIGEENSIEQNGSQAVKYLAYLMEGKYLSYLNERYLFASGVSESKNKICSISPFILLEEGEEKAEIQEINRSYQSSILKKYNKIYEEVLGVEGYRKNLKQYFNILKKQIMTCTVINEMSDTRVYATVLEEQLDIVLDSMSAYIHMFKEKILSSQCLDIMQENLKKAICTLDSYAQYILNNNLQSLQTPNYNVESNTSMEKVLIGYSEFLRVFIQFYWQKERLSDCSLSKEYLPVMVPNLNKSDVSVEILFQEGRGFNWEEEYEHRRRSGNNRYLMVVESPTGAELSNIPIMLTSLFHEMAHQFRYESRKDRNNSLVELFVRRSFAPMAKRISRRVSKEIGMSDSNCALEFMLLDCITEVCLVNHFGRNKNGEYVYDFQDVPLQNFQIRIKGKILEIVERWQNEDRLDRAIQNFKQELCFNYGVDNEIAGLTLIALAEAKEELEEAASERKTACRLKVERCAFCLAWYIAFELCADKEWKSAVKCKYGDLHKIKEEINIFIDLEEDRNYTEEWEKGFKGVKDVNVKRCWKAFYFLETFLWDDNQTAQDLIDVQYCKNDIADIYSYACEKWKKEKKTVKEIYSSCSGGAEYSCMDEIMPHPSYKYWTKVGRYLGLDSTTEGSADTFWKFIYSDIDCDVEAAWNRIAEYREETSDLFMCSAVQLTPFGYLNLMAFNLSVDDNYNEVFIKRIARVLYEKWCWTDGYKETAMKNYRQECFRIITTLERSLRKVNDNAECLNTGQADMEYGYIELGTDSGKEWMRHKIIQLKTDLEDGYEKFKETMEDQRWNASRMCGILYDLVGEDTAVQFEMNHDTQFGLDYGKGVLHLKDLYMGMKDGVIGHIAELSSEIAEYLNAGTGLFIEEQSEESNQHCIEFLMKMFYHNKLWNAKGVKGEIQNT